MMPTNHLPRKCTSGYKFTKSEEKMNHQMYVDDINLFYKKWNRIRDCNKKKTIRIYIQDREIEIGREKCSMLFAVSSRWMIHIEEWVFCTRIIK